MAGTSPRRSIRSRPSLPQNFTPQRSSTSSSTSGRAERTTRTSAKAESPRKQASNSSNSSEPLDDTVVSSVEDSISTRRRKRGQPEEPEKDTEDKDTEMSNGISEPVGEDDEAVRCICGSDDYPGPPQISEEDSKKGLKEGTEPDLLSPEDYTEDLAGFFLQCDICKVWQHGGCVGIKNEDMSPDEYFCELCKKELHKIYTASNGQKYSHYLPLYQHLSRSTSRAASYTKDGTRSPRSTSKTARPTSSSAMMDKNNPKRRSTMNSRDAAYNEEEQLRRAIEASKGEKGEAGEGSTRRGKRGRSDSEDKSQPVKRQRTTSRSVSPEKDSHRDGAGQDSDTEMNGHDTVSKKIRGAAARNHERKLREDRERARLEAANKRKGRAERRRVEDSDNGTDTPAQPTPRTKVEKESTVPETSRDRGQASPNGSPKEKEKEKIAATPQEKPKKGGRPPHPRKGKGGKNQYTREADDGSPARSASRDVPSRDETSDNTRTGHARLAKADTTDGHGPGRGRPASKGGRGASMVDMRKRVAGMLAFIQQTQIEMAENGETKTPPEGGANAMGREPPESEKDKAMKGVMTGIMSGIKAANPDAGGGDEKKAEDGEEAKEFKDLSLLKMMDVLTTELIKWQEQFA